MFARLSALSLDPVLRWFHVKRFALAGFAFGIALPLLLTSLAMVPVRGGLSDSPTAPPLAFFMDYD